MRPEYLQNSRRPTPATGWQFNDRPEHRASATPELVESKLNRMNENLFFNDHTSCENLSSSTTFFRHPNFHGPLIIIPVEHVQDEPREPGKDGTLEKRRLQDRPVPPDLVATLWVFRVGCFPTQEGLKPKPFIGFPDSPMTHFPSFPRHSSEHPQLSWVNGIFRG